jgi:hypothetical protein
MTEHMTAAQLIADQSKPKGEKNAAGKNSKRTFAHGLWFDSKKEAQRWGDLLLLEKAGQISDLKRQVRIQLIGRDGPILTPTGKVMVYKADFTYIEIGQLVVEDAKGYAADIYLIKKAILAAQGVNVREI